MGGQVYDRESIEKMYGKGGRTSQVGPLSRQPLGTSWTALLQCRAHVHVATTLLPN